MKRVVLSLLFLAGCSAHKAHRPEPMFVPPVMHPSTSVNLGAINRTTLTNGLQIISIPRKSNSVEMVLAVDVGQDPLSMSGLSDFVVSMLRKGTKTRTAAQISQTIDFVGGSLSSSSSDETVLIQCQVRSKDLQVCLNLISDMVQNPTFPQNEIDLLKQQSVGAIQGAKDSAQSLAAQHAASLYWGDGDVRGRPTSLQSIANMSRKAIVDFFEKKFAPNNSLLAISGDFDQALLEKTFGSWKKKPRPLPVEKFLKSSTELKVRVVDKPDATQSVIVIGGDGLSHQSKDYFAVKLMNYTLGGGGFSSRLMKVVRSEGGKTYGASSSFDAGRDAGPFTVSTFTRTSETASMIKLLLNEIEKMRSSGPTQEEMDAAKANIIGGFGLRLETGADLAKVLLSTKLDGLSDDYLPNYLKHMSEVTLEQAKEAASRYLTPNTLVIVGNAKEVIPQLKEIGITPNETVSYLEPVSKSERQKS